MNRLIAPMWALALLTVAGCAAAPSQTADTLQGGIVAGWDEDAYRRAFAGGDNYGALRLLDAGVAANAPRAKCIKAQTIFDGLYGPPDYAEIAALYGGLSFQQCQQRTVHLAVMYRDGLGVPRDTDLARHHFRKIVALLLGEGDFKQTFLYAEARLPAGFDVWSEIGEAYQWRDLVRDGWEGPRQYRLFEAYYVGRNVPQDMDMAFKVLDYAVRRGYGAAQFRMYEAVRDGEVAETAERQRLFLLEDAARNGVDAAQLELGMAHYNGVDAPADPEKAYGWLWRYAQAGGTGVDPQLAALEAVLGASRTQRIRERAQRGIFP